MDEPSAPAHTPEQPASGINRQIKTIKGILSSLLRRRPVLVTMESSVKSVVGVCLKILLILFYCVKIGP